MKVNIKAAAAPATDYVNKMQRNQMFGQALSGLLGGVKAGADIGISQQQKSSLDTALASQKGNLESALQEAGLSAVEKAILRNQIGQLDILGATNTLGNSGLVIEGLLGMQKDNPMIDLMSKLAVEKLKGDYGVQQASAYGAARNAFPNTIESGVAIPTKPNLFQNLGQLGQGVVDLGTSVFTQRNNPGQYDFSGYIGGY